MVSTEAVDNYVDRSCSSLSAIALEVDWLFISHFLLARIFLINQQLTLGRPQFIQIRFFPKLVFCAVDKRKKPVERVAFRVEKNA